MQKFYFEYSIDGFECDFKDFIRVAIITTRRKYIKTMFEKEYNILAMLCMVNYAEMVGVHDNRPIEWLKHALSTKFTLYRDIINAVREYNFESIANGTGDIELDGLVAQGESLFYCPHGCGDIRVRSLS